VTQSRYHHHYHHHHHHHHHHNLNLHHIIRHGVGLDRPLSTFSNSVFKGLPNRLCPVVYNSALFLVSCCCSFLLHDVDSLSCIFLVSPKLVLLPSLSKFLHSFCGKKKGVHGCFEKFNLD